MQENEKFHNIDDETKKFFNNVVKIINMPYPLKYSFVDNTSLKQAVKVSKISDMYSFLLESEILVTFNTELFDNLDDESKEILIRQELDKITVNIDNGKIKTVKPDVVTFSTLVQKFGFEKVARANKLNTLSAEQREDKLVDEFMASK